MSPLIWCFLACFSPASALRGTFMGASLPALYLLTQRLIDSLTHRPKISPVYWGNLLALTPPSNPPAAHQTPRIYARKSGEKTWTWTRINPLVMQKSNRLCSCPSISLPLVSPSLGALVLKSAIIRSICVHPRLKVFYRATNHEQRTTSFPTPLTSTAPNARMRLLDLPTSRRDFQ